MTQKNDQEGFEMLGEVIEEKIEMITHEYNKIKPRINRIKTYLTYAGILLWFIIAKFFLYDSTYLSSSQLGLFIADDTIEKGIIVDIKQAQIKEEATKYYVYDFVSTQIENDHKWHSYATSKTSKLGEVIVIESNYLDSTKKRIQNMSYQTPLASGHKDLLYVVLFIILPVYLLAVLVKK